MSWWYMLDIKHLPLISFASIFSHSTFNTDFLIVSSAMQKLLSFISSHLFIFAFIFFALGDRSKEILLKFM